MKKLLSVAALLGIVAFASPRANAVSYTLKDLVENNITVEVGCLSFSDFGMGLTGLGGVDAGNVLSSSGYAADGSQITIDFVQTANGVELRYSAFDITIIGDGTPMTVNGNVAFDYVVTALDGIGIKCAGESGAFGATVEPPTGPPVNAATASFNVDYGLDGSLSIAAAKTNTGVNIGLGSDELDFSGNPRTSLEAHKDLFVNLVLGATEVGAIYNVHVSDYIQEYCCEEVPEPGTMAMLAAGGVVGILIRRRRK